MSKVTLAQAAEMAGGISKQAIRKAIDAGKLTAEKDAHGHVLVQAGDVERVWPRQPVPEVTDNQLPLDTSRLQVENDLLRQQLEETRRDRDRWHQQAERMTVLVTDQRPSTSPWSWMRRLFSAKRH